MGRGGEIVICDTVTGGETGRVVIFEGDDVEDANHNTINNNNVNGGVALSDKYNSFNVEQGEGCGSDGEEATVDEWMDRIYPMKQKVKKKRKRRKDDARGESVVDVEDDEIEAERRARIRRAVRTQVRIYSAYWAML